MKRRRTFNSGRHRSLYALANQPRRRPPLEPRTGFGKRGMAKSKPKPWTAGRRKCVEEGRCRVCELAHRYLDPHHVIYRSLGGDDDPLNCLPACRGCHKAIHRKEVDVWLLLTDEERAHAAQLFGAGRALELLWPSQAYRRIDPRKDTP